MISTERLKNIGSAIILGVSIVLLADGGAHGQTYTARGEIGFLQEWEIKASLAKTATRSGDDYAGAATLRHTGLCSTNGVEEKSGNVVLKMLPKTADVTGTLSLPDDQCSITATAARHYAGLLKCKNGELIPLNLRIETSPAEKAP